MSVASVLGYEIMAVKKNFSSEQESRKLLSLLAS